MSARFAFEYAVLRVVPRVEREEFLNVGVTLFCDARDFLGARILLDEPRLLALCPSLDLTTVRCHLDGFLRVAEGGASAGPLGGLSLRERFRWLVAPRSTILQTSAPHGGLCEEPEMFLERLLGELVRVPSV